MNPVDSPRAERFTVLYEAHYAKVLAYCRRRLPAQVLAACLHAHRRPLAGHTL